MSMKLAGSNTLRSSALAHCYLSAEYCAPVWSRWAHTSLVDVQLNSTVRASHFWHPPFYTSPMTSSAVQHRTASPTKEGCRWQAGREYCQTRQLANPAWYPQPTIATIDIQEAAVAGLTTSLHQKSMEAQLEVGSGGLVCDPQSGNRVLTSSVMWSLLNRFRTEQGHCVACRRKWRLTDTDLCPIAARPRWCHTLSNPVLSV